MKQKHKRLDSRCKNSFSAWLTFLLMWIAFFAALGFVGVRLMGYTPYVVLSASMSPEINVGDVIYSQATRASDVQVGDVVTFVASDYQTVVTHRVLRINQATETIVTKGDANSIEDPPISFSQVLGVVRFSIPKLGYIALRVSTPPVPYILVGLCVVAVSYLLAYNVARLLSSRSVVPSKDNPSVPDSPSHSSRDDAEDGF